jgi:hypothetical protein
LFGLVEFYEAFYGWCQKVEVDESPSVVFWDEGGAAVYGASNLFLVVLCGVGRGSLEVVAVYEVLYFQVVLLGG